jgi:ribosomal subunit interface protein
MNIKYLFKDVTIDDRTRDYIEKRLSGVEKINKQIIKTEVEIDRDKRGLFRVEVMLMTPKDFFRAEETTESIEGSIDTVVDELKVQIVKKKSKLWTKVMRGARSIKKKMSVDKDARF